MSVQLQFDRIPPGVEVGPHRHGVETLVYVAAGDLVFEHGEDLERRVEVGRGDVFYEAPAENHLVRNEGTIDVLALLAAVDVDPRSPGALLRRWESDDEPVRRRVDARVVEDGGIRRRLLMEPGDFGTARFSIAEVEIDPDTDEGWHRHPVGEHLLVVLEGRGIVQVDGIEETLEPLKGIRIATGLVHRVENTGRQLLRFYVCSSPAADLTLDRQQAPAPRHEAR